MGDFLSKEFLSALEGTETLSTSYPEFDVALNENDPDRINIIPKDECHRKSLEELFSKNNKYLEQMKENKALPNTIGFVEKLLERLVSASDWHRREQNKLPNVGIESIQWSVLQELLRMLRDYNIISDEEVNTLLSRKIKKRRENE